MTKNLLALSALFVVTGTAFLIVGVTSPSVVKACKELRVPVPPFRSTLRNMNRRKREPILLCVNQGLFFLGIDLPDGTIYLPTPLEKRSSIIRAIAGLLLVGGMGTVVAALYFIVAACYAPDEKGKLDFTATKRNVTAAVIQAISVLLLLSGLSLYTNHKLKTIGDAQQFKLQIYSAMTGFDSVFDMKRDTPSKQNNTEVISDNDSVQLNITNVHLTKTVPNRGDDNETTIAPDDNEFSGDFFHGVKNSSFSNLRISSEINVSLSSPPEEGNKRKKRRTLENPLQRRRGPRRRPPQIMGLGFAILSQLENSSPTAGYSFYLLWTGCCSHVLTLFIAIYNSRTIFTRKKSQV